MVLVPLGGRERQVVLGEAGGLLGSERREVEAAEEGDESRIAAGSSPGRDVIEPWLTGVDAVAAATEVGLARWT